MTRRSKREIERAVEDLDGGTDGDDDTVNVVFKDTPTGEYYESREMDGDPVDPDALPGLTVVINRGTVVMMREHAEREGREILGPAEDTDRDAVRVRSE